MSISVDQDPWLRVELDDRQHYVRTTIHRLDDRVRDASVLASAFDVAFTAAIEESAAASLVADPPASGTRVTARFTPRPFPPLPDVRGRQPRWDLINNGTDDRDDAPLHVTGESGNGCVTVRLDAASSRGRLTSIDHGWLRQASPSRLAAAIDESFTNAYLKADIS